MLPLFMVCFGFGFIVLLMGLRKRRLHAIQTKFIGVEEYQTPKKTKSKKTKQVQDDKKSDDEKYIWHLLRNVYTPRDGLQKKGFVILLITMAVCFVINSIFLQLHFIVIFIASFFLGVYIVNILRTREITNDFEKNFPELLVILNGAISAGSNVNQALIDCSNAISGVLQQELKIIVRALEIGDEPTKVFDASYKRLPFKSYYFFLTALSVSLNSGAKLKEVLSRLSTSMTKAKAIEKKKNAMTSEARMSSKITAAIPFVFLFLMKFISPENFDFIMHNEKGRYILYYFLGSEAIGILLIMFLMRKI